MSTESRVIKIIAAQLHRDAGGLGPQMQLEALGLDSMGLVETIFALEEAFDITIPFNANAPAEAGFDGSATIAKVVAMVEALLADRAAA